jgi:hypothetical protein
MIALKRQIQEVNFTCTLCVFLLPVVSEVCLCANKKSFHLNFGIWELNIAGFDNYLGLRPAVLRGLIHWPRYFVAFCVFRPFGAAEQTFVDMAHELIPVAMA